MKNIIGLLITFACLASNAQAPRMLEIHKHDGTTDTTSFSRIDSATIGNLTSLDLHLNTGGVKSVDLSQIDSMLFPYIGGPAYELTQPSRGRIFHVGDSVTVQWNLNPAPVGEKAYFRMSLNGGRTWEWLTKSVCYMMYKSPTYAGTPCAAGVNIVAWPYAVTGGKYVGTWKFKISNPMAMPDAMAGVFNPISDSVVVSIHDYENSEEDRSPMFSVKP